MGQLGDEGFDPDGEALEENRSAVPSTLVLPGLQTLRRICNSARPSGGVGGSGGLLNKQSGGFTSARRFEEVAVSTTTAANSSSDPASRSVHYSSTVAAGGPGVSTKLQVILFSVYICTILTVVDILYMYTIYMFIVYMLSQVLLCLLGTLRQNSPEEKVVIVSNFTSTLDAIETAATGRFGECLRLDGKVPVDQRQPLVNRFNKEDDPSFLFLLSAKAGGVGINL